jgi:hypothetical protein
MRDLTSTLALVVLATLFLGACGSGTGEGGDDSGRDVPLGDTGDAFVADAIDTGDEGGDIHVPDATGDADDVWEQDIPDAAVDVLPDPAFFHAVRTHADRVVDWPYPQDEAIQYRTVDILPDLDVRALLAVGDQVLAGTSSGVYAWKEGVWSGPLVLPGADPEDAPEAILDLALSGNGSYAAVATADAVMAIPLDEGDGWRLSGPVTFTSVAVMDDGMLVAGTSNGVFAGGMGGFGPVEGTDGWDVADVAVIDDVIFVVTADGRLFRDLDEVVIPSDVGLPRALGGASTQAVRVACSGGLATVGMTGAASTTFLPGKGGLPTDRLTSVSQDGATVLVGHEIGATALVLQPGPGVLVEHYVSQRWLPDNLVTSVAQSADGSLWIGTSKGVSRILWVQRTLRHKAEELFDFWMERFWRMDGFLMSDTFTDDPWTPTTFRTSDFDNDGLWTQMGIGALCMAYAVTGEERYYEAARKAMETMFLLIDVPAVDFVAAGLGRGFITRSLVREDEPELFAQKTAEPQRWHPVTYKGTRYLWKDDTSSDETAGHFFGFPLFYDLCAKTGAERDEIAGYGGALARYIMEGDFTLIDLDGLPTGFGHWEPDKVSIAVDGLEACGNAGHDLEDCIGAYYGAGWLNGTQILGHMLAAWHMTGDRDFLDAYEYLVSQHRYGEMVQMSREAATVSLPSLANHSDHELAMLAYATLIRYEPDDARRALWIDGLAGLHEYEIPERQPLWAAIMALAEPGTAHVADAVQSLREMPVDHRDWLVDNSHRLDAVRQTNDRFSRPQWDTVFPYDEIRTMWWNGNPYAFVGGSQGRNIVAPMPYLLAYWAQRYSGILVESGE